MAVLFHMGYCTLDTWLKLAGADRLLIAHVSDASHTGIHYINSVCTGWPKSAAPSNSTSECY